MIIKKLALQVKDKERMDTITAKLNETWTKLLPLWKQIDVKYMAQIPRLESKILELDYNNPKLDNILQTYERIVNTSTSVYDVEKNINSISDIEVRVSLLELFRTTRDITQIAVELN